MSYDDFLAPEQAGQPHQAGQPQQTGQPHQAAPPQQPQPQPPYAHQPPPQPPPGAPEPPAAPRRRGGRLALVLGAVLVLGAAGGGLTYTYLQADKADRTAPTKIWQRPAADKDDKAGDALTAHTGLGKKLLPVPDGYYGGPDIAEFGNDAEMSSKQAVALFKQSGRGLPRSERREFGKYVDRMKLDGLAMRSYTEGSELVVEIQLAQMSKRAVHDYVSFETRLNQRIGSTKGPSISGYKDAKCFVLKGESGDKLQVMDCIAERDDILVSFTAYGTKPLDKKAAAALLKKQLDYIESPGEAA
ncbi:hypothetical protein AB0M28_19200 [Streptomyces sp. NPDC051940]|uniref:hypothetical protein n=1 Tax=Streptomyces sp. NPDC051940 TaxID=3155675 RepID=UPI00341D8E03